MRHESGDDVHLRIGVNTGEVLVGALRAGGDYTAMGDVVNTASRLQAVAGPDQVIVGPATHAAARRGVRYEPLGPIAVRGREEPVSAWLAVGAVAPPGHRHGRAETPLIGRDSEVTVLRAALATATTRKRAHLVLVTGEAGRRQVPTGHGTGRDRVVRAGRTGPHRAVHPVRRDQRVVADRDDGGGRGRGRPHRSARPPSPSARASTVQRRARRSTTTTRRSARITEGLLYLMNEAGPGRGGRPDPRPRGRAAGRARVLRRAREHAAVGARALGPALGRRRGARVPPPAAHARRERAGGRGGHDPAGADRPVVTARGPSQHGAREPRPARDRRHRPAPARAAPGRRPRAR